MTTTLFDNHVIVVVTGGRDFADKELLYWGLNKIHERTPITVVRHGAMTGADALASRWCYDNGVDTDPYGAKWRTVGRRAAGPERNARMLRGAPVPSFVVGFPGGRGTTNCLNTALEMGYKTLYVEDYRIWDFSEWRTM